MKKKIIFTVLTICVLIGVVAFIFRDKSSVSHFVSEEGRQKFLAAYNVAMSRIPSPDKTLDIKTSYGTARLYYFSGGHVTDDRPLLLLPGRSASTPMWEPNLAGLLKTKPVYTIDLIGEPGMSTQTKAIKGDDDQAKWLNEVIQQLPEQKINLVGLSIGGWTAANYAVHYQDKLASLTLLDPVFTFDSIPISTILVSLPASIPAIPTSIRNYMLSYISGGAQVSKDNPVSNLIETGMHTFTVKSPTPTLLTKDQLCNVNIPVMALMAGKSVLNHPPVALEHAKQYLKQGTVKNYPDASHAINGEFASQVTSDIAEFTKLR